MATGVLDFREAPPDAARRIAPDVRLSPVPPYLMWALTASADQFAQPFAAHRVKDLHRAQRIRAFLEGRGADDHPFFIAGDGPPDHRRIAQPRVRRRAGPVAVQFLSGQVVRLKRRGKGASEENRGRNAARIVVYSMIHSDGNAC